jgi:hypothetical protein
VDPREEVEQAIAEERRRGAQSGCPLLRHRRNFTGGIFQVPAKAGNPKTSRLEKGGDLRKPALRALRAGDMIGALGMETTISER